MFATVWWVMHYPHEPRKAFQGYVKTYVAAVVADRPAADEIPISAEWARALIEGPSIAELQRDAALSVRDGVTAGLVLLNCRLTANLGRPVSLNTAIELVVRASEFSDVVIGGAKAHPNKGEIHRAWKWMKQVAHLWAAGNLVHLDPTTAEIVAHGEAETIRSMLRASVTLLEWATSQQVGGRGQPRTSLVSLDEAWRLPDFIEPLDLQQQIDPEAAAFVTAAIDAKRDR